MAAHSNVADSRLATPAARRPGALYWLALGTFAIGTEGFMIAALLTTIAEDIHVSVARAGLLVSAPPQGDATPRLAVAREPSARRANAGGRRHLGSAARDVEHDSGMRILPCFSK